MVCSLWMGAISRRRGESPLKYQGSIAVPLGKLKIAKLAYCYCNFPTSIFTATLCDLQVKYSYQTRYPVPDHAPGESMEMNIADMTIKTQQSQRYMHQLASREKNPCSVRLESAFQVLLKRAAES